MKVKKEITREEALDRLRQICAKTEKSKHFAYSKLTQWGVTINQEQIVNQLEEENFINEERFAQAFARDKYKFQKWGKVKISYQLKMMKVPEAITRAALENIDTDAYSEIVKSEISKKAKSIKSTDKYQLRQKLFQFGNQRGYESDLLNEILDCL